MANEINRRIKNSSSSSPTTDDVSDSYSSDGEVRSFCDVMARSMSFSSQESLLTAVAKTGRSDTNLTDNGSIDGIAGKDFQNLLRFDPRQKDFEKVFDEKLQTPGPGSSPLIEWLPNVKIITVYMHGKQPSFEKHNERIVPNQWRRVGPCMKLHSIGGHVTAGKRRSQLKEVKKGTPPPKAPTVPEFTLHRDENPKGARIPIQFDMPGKNVPGNIASRILSSQMQDRVVAAWKKEPWYDFKDKDNQAGYNQIKKAVGSQSLYLTLSQQKQSKSRTESSSMSSSTDSSKSNIKPPPKKRSYQ